MVFEINKFKKNTGVYMCVACAYVNYLIGTCRCVHACVCLCRVHVRMSVVERL